MNYMMAILPKMGGFLLLVLIGFTAALVNIFWTQNYKNYSVTA